MGGNGVPMVSCECWWCLHSKSGMDGRWVYAHLLGSMECLRLWSGMDGIRRRMHVFEQLPGVVK
jgi:hypothetical protein